VAAKYYLENFASDRSHMIDKQTGKYQAEPPKYDCIKCESKRFLYFNYLFLSLVMFTIGLLFKLNIFRFK